MRFSSKARRIRREDLEDIDVAEHLQTALH
jgi:hypothetical protein